MLGYIGVTQAETVVPALLPLLHDTDWNVRQAVAKALGQVGTAHAETVVPALLPLLHDTDWNVRFAAVEALPQIGGTQAETIVPALLTLLRDAHGGVRFAAAEALRQLGAAHAETVVPALLPLLHDTDSSVRQAVVQALPHQAETVVPALLPLLRDENSEVRRTTIGALLQLGGAQAEMVVPALLPLLRDVDGYVRRTTAEALAVSWLFLAQQKHEQPVSNILLAKLTESKSRFDARYRRSIVLALAHWYHAGRPEAKTSESFSAEGATDNTWQPDVRAQGEHEALQKALEKLCYTEPRLWLRSAACQVWEEAYLLQANAFR